MFLAEATAIGYDSFSSIVSALTSQLSVTTVVGVLAALAGVAVPLVFMWWGVRKGVSVLMAAFKKGKVRV